MNAAQRDRYRAAPETLEVDGVWYDRRDTVPGLLADTRGALAAERERTALTLRYIIGQCGIPDPVEACRQVIATCERALAAASSSPGQDPGRSQPVGKLYLDRTPVVLTLEVRHLGKVCTALRHYRQKLERQANPNFVPAPGSLDLNVENLKIILAAEVVATAALQRYVEARGP